MRKQSLTTWWRKIQTPGQITEEPRDYDTLFSHETTDKFVPKRATKGKRCGDLVCGRIAEVSSLNVVGFSAVQHNSVLQQNKAGPM